MSCRISSLPIFVEKREGLDIHLIFRRSVQALLTKLLSLEALLLCSTLARETKTGF